MYIQKMLRKCAWYFENFNLIEAVDKGFKRLNIVLFEKYERYRRQGNCLFVHYALMFASAASRISLLPKVLNDREKLRVLFVTRDLNETDETAAAIGFVEAAKKAGFAVLVISPIDGMMRKTVAHRGMPVLVISEYFLEEAALNIASFFNIAVINTISLFQPVVSLLENEIPTVWMIREKRIYLRSGLYMKKPFTDVDHLTVAIIGKDKLPELNILKCNAQLSDIKVYEEKTDVRRLLYQKILRLNEKELSDFLASGGRIREFGQAILTNLPNGPTR